MVLRMPSIQPAIEPTTMVNAGKMAYLAAERKKPRSQAGSIGVDVVATV